MFNCIVFEDQFVDGIYMGDITKGLIHKKFQNWKGHTHIETLSFCNAIVRLTQI
jgi:hypothetical protein